MLESKDKRESFSKDSKFPPCSINSLTLLRRTKVSDSLDSTAAQLFKLLGKYSPENKKEKANRLKAEGAQKAAGKDAKNDKKPVTLKYGLSHITQLVESGNAKLVAIAHDVDPIELVLHLPTLCRKKGIPFCVVKGKARLGKLVHQKTATAVALTEVRKEDYQDLETLQKNFRSQYNDNTNVRRHWGGGIMGIKNVHKMDKRQKLIEAEEAKKANM